MIQVRKYWSTDLDNAKTWDRVTAWCFETCGMPGETRNWNYQTDVDYMDFFFRDPKNAEFFILKWM